MVELARGKTVDPPVAMPAGGAVMIRVCPSVAKRQGWLLSIKPPAVDRMMSACVPKGKPLAGTMRPRTITVPSALRAISISGIACRRPPRLDAADGQRRRHGVGSGGRGDQSEVAEARHVDDAAGGLASAALRSCVRARAKAR